MAKSQSKYISERALAAEWLRKDTRGHGLTYVIKLLIVKVLLYQ